jgi:two-component system sensor kinase FixL
MNRPVDLAREVEDLRRRLAEAERALAAGAGARPAFDGAPRAALAGKAASTFSLGMEDVVVDADPSRRGRKNGEFRAGVMTSRRDAWLELAVAAGGVGVFDVDLVTGAAQCSGAMQQLFGLAADEITFDTYARMVLDEDRERFEARFKAACNPTKGGTWSDELRIRRADGGVRWVAFSGQIEFRRAGDGWIAARLLGTAVDVTRGKKIEDELRRNNERLRLALDVGSLACWEYDLGAGVAQVDGKYREIYGFDADVQLTLERILAIVWPEDAPLVVEAIGKALDPRGTGCYCAEFRIRRPSDGETRWISSSAQAVFENERAVRLIGVSCDVTDKKATERELLEKAKLAEQFAGVAASVPGLIASFRLEPQGRASLAYASPSLEDVFGLPADELSEGADPILRRIHVQDIGHVRSSIARSAASMAMWRGSYRYDHPRKGWIWIEAQFAPTREAGGSILWHGYIRDVTARKRIEQSLIEKEARLHATVEGAHDAIVTMDERGVIQSLNPAALRMFGYAAEEALGQPIDLLIPSAASVARGCSPERWSKARETEGRRKDKSPLLVDMTIGEAAYHGRRLLIAFMRDSTERREIEERLRSLHAERLSAMGELAAGLAHELNQPLSATALYLKAARRLLRTPSELRPTNVEDALDNASTQIIRAGRIISHLREFIARGEPDKTIQHLHDLIDEANELVIADAKQAGIQMRFHLNAKNDLILADRVQIKQVIVNLMRNAKDAMSSSKQRKMVIATAPVGKDMIKLEVADTGCGLAEDVQKRLFEPFTTTKINGIGVGLSISRSIVEAHYGTIWAKSNRDGGATFSFTLPLAETEAHR